MTSSFFVIGAARSGTNLLARVLGRHPSCNVVLDPLLPIFRSLRDAVLTHDRSGELSQRYPKGSPFQDYYFDCRGVRLLDAVLEAEPDLSASDAELDCLRRACVARAALESPATAQQFAALQGRTYRELVESASRIVTASGEGLLRCGFKEVWIHDFIPWIARALPGCRFICIERDPRAVMASLLAVAARDPTQAAHGPSYMRHWRKGVALVRRFLSDPLLGQRISLVHYEDLVTDADAVARRLCEFLDLPYVDSMTAVSADGWHGNSGYDVTGPNIFTDSLHRWHDTLPADVTRAVDYLCGPEMRLTPYAAARTEALAPAVAAYVARANAEPYSWRSDSGVAETDLAWEALRHEMLAAGQPHTGPLARRCFLFSHTLNAARSQDPRSHAL